MDMYKLERLLSKAKITLLTKKGSAFLGSLMCNSAYAWDDKIPTACTDGNTITFNPEFFLSIPHNTRVFVLAHELWHNAFLHCFRLDGRDPELWNIAGDHVINTMLLNDGYTIDGLKFPIYQDFKYHEWSVDRVYEDLLENNPPPPSPDSCNGGLHQDITPSSGSDKEHEKNRIEAVQKVVHAHQVAQMSNQAGNVPGEIVQIIDTILNPVIPWEELLINYLTELSNEDYSYRRPNRRYDDMILPTLYTEGSLEELNWYIDVSGSVTDEMITRFFSEMYHVKETLRPSRINIIQFDYGIRDELVLESNDDFQFINIIGRGGTSLKPVRKHILETNPTVAIIFSDLDCSPMKEVPQPVIWAVFDEYGWGQTPDFGTVIKIKEKTNG